jgi:branched-chain amino acid transport system ATP-binding protein
MSVLQLHNLSKEFGGVLAVNQVNLTIEKGEIHALVGPNGAGKTTLVNLVTGIYRPTTGEMRFEDQKLASNPTKIRRAGITRTFQNLRLFKSMTVLENCLVSYYGLTGASLMGSIFRGPRFRANQERALEASRDALQLCGLLDMENALVDGLPYGWQKRVEIARALVGHPKLLILDEPVAGLNESESREVLEQIRRIVEKTHCSILLIEHDMIVVRALAQKVTVLNFGQVVMTGEPNVVLQDERVIEAYLGSRIEGESDAS